MTYIKDALSLGGDGVDPSLNVDFIEIFVIVGWLRRVLLDVDMDIVLQNGLQALLDSLDVFDGDGDGVETVKDLAHRRCQRLVEYFARCLCDRALRRTPTPVSSSPTRREGLRESRRREVRLRRRRGAHDLVPRTGVGCPGHLRRCNKGRPVAVRGRRLEPDQAVQQDAEQERGHDKDWLIV